MIHAALIIWPNDRFTTFKDHYFGSLVCYSESEKVPTLKISSNKSKP